MKNAWVKLGVEKKGTFFFVSRFIGQESEIYELYRLPKKY
jgi:hypothetical protein